MADVERRIVDAGASEDVGTADCAVCGHITQHERPHSAEIPCALCACHGTTAELPMIVLCACGHTVHYGPCEAYTVEPVEGPLWFASLPCACTVRKMTLEVEASMIRRYGPEWRTVFAGRMADSARERLRDILGSYLRDCRTWKPAGVEVDALEAQLRTLDWLLSEDNGGSFLRGNPLR